MIANSNNRELQFFYHEKYKKKVFLYFNVYKESHFRKRCDLIKKQPIKK